MIKHFRLIKTAIFYLSLILPLNSLLSQGGFDNPTRALYIFDLSRYIDYGPGFADSSNFKIGVLPGDYDLVYESGDLAKTADKPLAIVSGDF